MSYQFAEHTSQMEWFHQDSEAVVNQTSSRPRNSETVTMTFLFLLFGARLALGSVLECVCGPATELLITISSEMDRLGGQYAKCNESDRENTT